jgi:hypothetical protein
MDGIDQHGCRKYVDLTEAGSLPGTPDIPAITSGVLAYFVAFLQFSDSELEVPAFSAMQRCVDDDLRICSLMLVSL